MTLQQTGFEPPHDQSHDQVGEQATDQATDQGAWLVELDVRYALPQRVIATGSSIPVPHDLATHLQTYGPAPAVGAASGLDAVTLLDVLESAGLNGRGGAHFPVATKWRTARDAARRAGRGVVLIANGTEGEPGIAKDITLMRLRPHLLLDGLFTAAAVLGAIRLVIYLGERDHASLAALQRAVTERRAAGAVEPTVELLTGPDRYVTGEANAVVRAVNEGIALPAFPRVLPAVSGVAGLPTVVQNVDSLTRVALFARYGPDAAQAGAVVSVLDGWAQGGPQVVVREVGARTSLAQAVSVSAAAVSGVELQAVLVGGFGGQWVPWRRAAGWTIGEIDHRRGPDAAGSPGAVSPASVSLGAGLLAPLPVTGCGVMETAALLEYLAESSAKQCGPCLYGTQDVARAWRRLADGSRGGTRLAGLLPFGRRPDAWQHGVRTVGAEMAGRGGCALPDGAVSVSVSALETFADEIDLHLAGRCSITRSARSARLTYGVI